MTKFLLLPILALIAVCHTASVAADNETTGCTGDIGAGCLNGLVSIFRRSTQNSDYYLSMGESLLTLTKDEALTESVRAKHKARALKYLDKAANMKNPEALGMLVDIYLKRPFTALNTRHARKRLKTLETIDASAFGDRSRALLTLLHSVQRYEPGIDITQAVLMMHAYFRVKAIVDAYMMSQHGAAISCPSQASGVPCASSTTDGLLSASPPSYSDAVEPTAPPTATD